MLPELASQLRQSLGILHKRDIQVVSRFYRGVGNRKSGIGSQESGVRSQELKSEESTQDSKLLTQNFSPSLPGDDCAAIPDGDGYLLLAAEGMLPLLVDEEPWFAGWCAVMVNVSDVYAMGGRPVAVVDTLWSQSAEYSKALWEGMQAAAQTYSVPIVGGHTNCHSSYNALSVSILGRANKLITSFDAQPGDRILLVSNFRGKPHPKHPFWNAATHADPVQLRGDLELLPQIAEADLCDAGKDISMGGIVGTLLMLLEASNCGAILDLDKVPCPNELSLEHWLSSFPSYGFLLSVRPENVVNVQAQFHTRELICEVIGEVTPTSKLVLQSEIEQIVFWDLAYEPLTGFSKMEAMQ
jgi:AIR synthase-related protein